MEAKFRKYWTDIQGLMGIATLLDPQFKYYMLLHCFEVLLGTTRVDCEYEVEKVKDCLSDLMSQYHSDGDEGSSSSSKATPVLGSGFLSSFSAHVASIVPSSMRFKSELDRYLEDEMVDIHTKGFDILD
jgi:hypothetical protein